MITWMQKHHRWLVITIWISTIAFIGAGFFGWGQYNYSSKSGTIANVGSIKITYKQFNQSYNQMFAQYKQVFHGHFDKAQAKAIGLKREVLAKLIDQALVLNLAKNYHITVSNLELYNQLTKEKVFYKNGSFNDATYKALLANNNLTPHTYENGLKRQILIQKVLKLFPNATTPLERETLGAIFNLQNRIKYEILSFKDIKISISQKGLKKFYNQNKQYLLTQPAYSIDYIKQVPLHKLYTKSQILRYYDIHKMDFKDSDGKIKSLKDANSQIIQALNQKATKIAALKAFIAFKKHRLDKAIQISHATINSSHNIFNKKILDLVKTLNQAQLYLKPKLINNHFVIIKLNKKIPAKPMLFTQARPIILKQYVLHLKNKALLKLAQASYENIINATITPYINIKDISKIKDLSKQNASKFLSQLFQSSHKHGYIVLQNNKIVLYNILEQRLLNKKQINIASDIYDLKQQLLNPNIIRILSKHFKTKIYLKGF